MIWARICLIQDLKLYPEKHLMSTKLSRLCPERIGGRESRPQGPGELENQLLLASVLYTPPFPPVNFGSQQALWVRGRLPNYIMVWSCPSPLPQQGVSWPYESCSHCSEGPEASTVHAPHGAWVDQNAMAPPGTTFLPISEEVRAPTLHFLSLRYYAWLVPWEFRVTLKDDEVPRRKPQKNVFPGTYETIKWKHLLESRFQTCYVCVMLSSIVCPLGRLIYISSLWKGNGGLDKMSQVPDVAKWVGQGQD